MRRLKQNAWPTPKPTEYFWITFHQMAMNVSTFQHELLETISTFGIKSRERSQLLRLAEKVEIDQQDYMRIRSKVFDMAKEQGIAGLDWLEDAMKILDRAKAITYTSTAYFSPDNSGRDELKNSLLESHKCIWVCVFTISDNDLSSALINRHKAGLEVKVITDDEKIHDKGSDIFKLKEAGVPVKVDASRHHMHHKFAIIDKETFINGSYNWTRSADEYNHENLILTKDEALVSAFTKEFNRLWAAFNWL